MLSTLAKAVGGPCHSWNFHEGLVLSLLARRSSSSVEILHHVVVLSDLFVDCFLCLTFLRSIDSMFVISVRHIPDKALTPFLH